MTTVKQSRSNYKALYLKKCRRDFSKQFWSKDLPILLGVGLFIAVAGFCLAVKALETLLKQF